MSAWILVPCLVRLRAEFDDIAPGRAHASDGSIGDTVHAQGGTSDHLPDEDFPALRDKDADSRNEVHAIDVDSDLRTPGLTMELVVQFLLGRCRSGAETRLRYIIYNRRIWEASNGWRQRAYDGPSPHTEHAHFSASYDTAREASTASWHLEDLVALTDDDKADVRAIMRDEIARGWTSAITTGGGSRDGMLTTLGARTGATTNQQLPAVLAKLDVDQVDEPAIVAGVLAGLDPAAIAAAIPLDLARRVADELAARLAA